MDQKNQQNIEAIVEEQSALIEEMDNDIMMEHVGVAMALDKLRDALNLLEAHLDEREFEKASSVGYNEVAHNFVYVQRTLSGLQTSVFKKESLISGVAQKASAAYEDVTPFVEKKMQSSIKKSELSEEELLERQNFVLNTEQWLGKFQKGFDDPEQPLSAIE